MPPAYDLHIGVMNSISEQIVQVNPTNTKIESEFLASIIRNFKGENTVMQVTGLMVKTMFCTCTFFVNHVRIHFRESRINFSRVMRKCVLCHMRTTKAQISLRIRAV